MKAIFHGVLRNYPGGQILSDFQVVFSSAMSPTIRSLPQVSDENHQRERFS